MGGERRARVWRPPASTGAPCVHDATTVSLPGPSPLSVSQGASATPSPPPLPRLLPLQPLASRTRLVAATPSPTHPHAAHARGGSSAVAWKKRGGHSQGGGEGGGTRLPKKTMVAPGERGQPRGAHPMTRPPRCVAWRLGGCPCGWVAGERGRGGAGGRSKVRVARTGHRVARQRAGSSRPHPRLAVTVTAFSPGRPPEGPKKPLWRPS